jgi:hypothetical protein
MRTFTTSSAAVVMLLIGAVPAFAACSPIQVGALSGDPERDTFGLLCETKKVDRTDSVSSATRGQILQIGVSTGEAEKDTFGYVQLASAQ